MPTHGDPVPGVRALRARRVWLLEIPVLVALLLLGALFIRTVGGLTDRRMQALKTEAVAALEQRLQRRVSYESLSPSIFGFLALRNLSVYSIQDPAAVLLSVSRLKIQYNLFRLLGTRSPLEALSGVQISNSRFDIDYARDRELIELLSRLTSGTGRRPGYGAAARPLDISGTNLTVRYRSGNWQLAVGNLFFTVQPEPESYRVSVRGTLEAERTPAAAAGLSRLSSRLKVSGHVAPSLDWTDLAVSVYTLSTPAVELKRQTFQVSYDASSLRIRKIQDRSPLDLQLVLDTERRRLSAHFVAEGLKPSSVFAFSGPLARLAPALQATITADGTLELAIDSRRASYTAELSVAAPPGLLPMPVTAAGSIRGDERVLYLSPLRLDSERGSVEFRGNLTVADLLPSGLLQFVDFEPLAGRPLDATLQVDRRPRAVTLRGDSLRFAGSSFQAVELVMRPSISPRGLDFTLSAAVDSRNPRIPGDLRLGGRLLWSRRPALEVAGGVSGIRLNTLYRVLRAQRSERVDARLADFTLALTGSARTDFDGFEVSAPTVQLTQVSAPANEALFAVQANGRSVTISGLEARWSDYELSGEAEVSLSKEGADLRTRLRFQDTPYELTAEYRRPDRLSLAGSYGLRGALEPMGWGDAVFSRDPNLLLRGRAFRLASRELPVPLRGGTALLSLDIEGLIGADGKLYALSPRTVVRNLPVRRLPANSLEAGFLLRDGELLLNRVAYQDAVSSLSGSGRATIERLVPLTLDAALELAARGSPERYDLEGSVAWPRVQGLLDLNRSPLARLGAGAVTGELTGTLGVSGNWPEPTVDASLRLEEGRLNLDRLELGLSARYSARRFTLNSLDLGFLRHRMLRVQGSLDLNDGQFQFRVPYRGEYFGKVVELTGELRGRASGAPLSLREFPASSTRAELKLASVRVDGTARPEWPLRLEASAGRFLLAGGPGAAEALRIEADRSGAFALTLGAALPIQGNAAGQLRSGRIESLCQVESLDIRVLNTVLAKAANIIRFNEGNATGTLRIRGAVNDPDWDGALDIRGAELVFVPSPDPVGPIDTRLVFEQKEFYLPRTATKSGRTPVEAEGTFYLDHWVPEALELFFYIEQTPGVHIRYTFGPVYADGYASGAVRVRSDETGVLVQGKVQANTCRVALEREVPAPVEGPPGAPLSVELQIQTGRTVEFYWPAMTFPVLRAYARQGEKLSLRLDGDTGEFALLGNVQIRGGEIFYFDRNFYLKEGSIAFEESATELDPWIKALAEVRERDASNRDVTIYLEANNKLSQFSPRFYSVPSLPDVEILDMIGATIFNRFEDTDFGTAAVMLTSDIVSQFGILSPFERAVREVLGLDLFSVRTQFLQNVLLGRLRGPDADPSLFNPLDNTTLSLGKYLGTDLFLEALVRFESAEGIDSGAGGVRTQGELNLEWATPFFLLEWTLTPMHPENLFVSDNSIGISWKFSY